VRKCLNRPRSRRRPRPRKRIFLQHLELPMDSIFANTHRFITVGPPGVASILRTVVWEICCPEGTHRTLSRRDGVSWATPHIRRPWSKNVLSTESYRSLRDGFFLWHTPGNKLPGYDHSVPLGQKTLNACPRIRRRITLMSPVRGRGRERYETPEITARLYALNHTEPCDYRRNSKSEDH
jgi:hypothetical protein